MTAAEPAASVTDSRTSRWGAVVAAGLAVFVSTVDMNVVGVALPTLGQRFGAGPGAVQWVVLAYVLPLVALVLPVGRWADGAGTRPAFLLAVLGFGAASVLVAASTGLPVMIVARGVQGVFGALVAALVMSVIGRSVRPADAGRAMGLVAAVGPLGGAVGPALGGVLIAEFGWRSVFLINVPVCLAAAWLGLRSIPAGDGGLPAPRRSWLADALLLGAAGSALILGLQELGRPGARPPWAFALPVVAVGAVALWVRRPAARPVRAVLADSPVRGWLLALLAGGVVSGALGFLTPYLLAGTLRVPTAQVGLVMLAMPAGMVLCAPLGGVLGDRWGQRRTALAGTCLMLVGAALLVPAATDWGPTGVAWRLLLVGAGSGLLAAPAQAAIMTGVPPARTATAGALSALLLNVGFALGPALGSMTWGLRGNSATGMATAFATAAVAAAVSTACVTLVRGRRARNGAPHATRHSP
ncbi:MFS transporter [Actinokineospora sp. NBRC 105648]|uniref:MFS transporter n=1 Tax=Actinokineospora sp. NBRC 105648 TaxID=3032206 RepID=UPI0024A5A514|nr:MFS transporter [Actinokineospora sp. NBRC 105648]GLZ42023.1 MFS transporter [Actinokineospora sp. NBRC 105648]